VLVQGVQDVLGGLGLGAIAGQLADLQLGELLDTPPPGLDEAVAIAKVHTTPCACGLILFVLRISVLLLFGTFSAPFLDKNTTLEGRFF